MPDYPQEGALRGGHIPSATSVPWARAAAEDGTFKPRAELEAIYQGEAGLTPGRRRHRLLPHRRAVQPHLVRAEPPAGLRDVRNYDGSWTEWGNGVRVPIDRGDEPVTQPPISGATLPPAAWPRSPTTSGRPDKDRLQLLLEFCDELPALPERYAGHPELMERVPECQSPLFLAVEVGAGRRRCTCSSTRPPSRRPPAASPRSCTRASTV